ncbi:MAG: beta-lactamase family protein [Phycisphaeraceae bacterium]|nr:beta-lactamase family protein [Phycisphaeraceae bacterium]MBX3368226.1 beta-lactamase family protein [Phycisphaeraceae bacterium]
MAAHTQRRSLAAPRTMIALLLAIVAVAPAVAQPESDPCRPVRGCAVPALSSLDALMLEFVCTRNIGAATIAVTRNGTLIYERGFGWADEARSQPIAANALMRIASVSKPITAAAVRELIAEGAFTLDTKAFNLGQPGGGLLDLAPFPSLGDPRLADVTVRHLIEHKGGWNRDIAGDLTYMEIAIASAMGISSPPGRENTVRYILGKPLQHTPGTTESYSNIGMLALGLIVEQHRGKPLQEVLDPIMAASGVAINDHQIGRTFKADQDPREPFYDATALGPNVYNPGGPLVRAPYGTWDHEARAGQGAHIATAAALAKFAAHYYVNGPNIGRPRPANDSGTWRWNHTGSLAGTNSLIRQRGDGITYAVIFNKRAPSGDWAGQARTAIDALFDSGSISWPTSPPACCPADYNTDGGDDILDFLDFFNDFGQCDQLPAPCGTLGNPDLNGDTIIDILDFLDFLDAFGRGC